MADILYKSGPPLPFGAIDKTRARQYVVSTGVASLNLGAYEGQGYLIKVAPFDRTLVLDLPGPLPFGAIDRQTARSFRTTGKAATIYPAATGNAARSTDADDTPAETWVGPYFDGRFNYEISLFAGADPTSQGRSTIGTLTLIDPRGDLDDLRSKGFDGAPVEILRGAPDARFADYVTIAKLSAAAMTYDARRKVIALRDIGWQLANAELHGNRYGGTGGLDGDATLKGQIKPYAVGQVFNVSPTQIGADLLCYQVSCSSVRAISDVRNAGVSLASAGDFATYDALAAAVIAGGSYATCIAEGIFRLGSSPAANLPVITADVQGDDDTINGLGYPSSRAEIARRIVTGRGNIRLDDATQIDGAAYRALEQLQPAPLGFFWNAEITKAAALTEVMAGCLGWWFVRLDGRLAIGQLDDPTTLAAAFSLSYPADGLTSEVRVGEPAMPDYGPPRRQTLVSWSRNYTPMAVNQIAGSVDQLTAAIYRADARFASAPDPWVAANYPTSPVVTIAGDFVFEVDAQREAERQQRLLHVPREAFEIPATIDPVADVVGRVITILNQDRFDFGTSRNLFCSGVNRGTSGRSVLTLWG